MLDFALLFALLTNNHKVMGLNQPSGSPVKLLQKLNRPIHHLHCVTSNVSKMQYDGDVKLSQ